MSLSLTELSVYAFALFLLFLTPGPVWVALTARCLQESGSQRGLVGDDYRQRRSGDDRGCTGMVESRKQHAGLAGAAGRCLKGFLHTHAGTHEHRPDHPQISTGTCLTSHRHVLY